jgi:predicted lactoylglutathione lyase
MTKQVFINLPVDEIEKSLNFYLELGFTINPEFTDSNQKCIVWSEHIYIMLQSQEMFRLYIKKQKPDPKKYQTASYTLPVESFDRVNEIMESGLKAGGSEPIPMIDEGFMQIRTIEDFDGHTWGFIHLDMKKFKDK